LVSRPTADTADAARALVEELLYAGLTITDLLASLLDKAPEVATPEDGETIVELVISTCLPALAKAPPDDCLVAVALLHAIRERILESLATEPPSPNPT
jgi:hypothetical protein